MSHTSREHQRGREHQRTNAEFECYETTRTCSLYSPALCACCFSVELRSLYRVTHESNIETKAILLRFAVVVINSKINKKNIIAHLYLSMHILTIRDFSALKASSCAGLCDSINDSIILNITHTHNFLQTKSS